MAAVRNMSGLAFTAGAAASFLILTGLIGWQPPPNINFHNATWRLGTWTGDIISQYARSSRLAIRAPRSGIRHCFSEDGPLVGAETGSL